MQSQKETHTYHYITDEAPTAYSYRFVMDAKCGCCQPYPIDIFSPMIRVSYGYVVDDRNAPEGEDNV